jgi:hypothetical protein
VQRRTPRSQRPDGPAAGLPLGQLWQDAGKDQRRFPGAGGTYNQDEALVAKAAKKLGDLATAPVEEASPGGVEGDHPWVRTCKFLRGRFRLIKQLPKAGALLVPARSVGVVQPDAELNVQRDLARLEQHWDQTVASIRYCRMGGQLLAEGRPLVGKVGGREHYCGESAVPDGTLKFLDHRRAKAEMVLGQHPVGRQSKRGQ